MDLWIREQRGCGVIKSSGVVIVSPSADDEDESYLLADYENCDFVYGVYGTAQDCVDILNEIQKLIICAIRDGKSGVVFSMPTINRKESKENE
jgi:hypothetical protein